MTEEECEHVWQDIDGIACETCGDHSGVICTECYEVVDFVYSSDPRDG